VVTIYISRNKDLASAWFKPDKDCFSGIKEYLKIGIPSSAMLCLEWWSFEVITIFAGYISVDSAATQIICINTNVICFMVPTGLC
jgi:MATE family multidrug resistance protein